MKPVFAVLVGASLLATVIDYISTPEIIWRFAMDVPAAQANEMATFETVFKYDIASGHAHAAALVPTGDGFKAIWFEGSQEGADDIVVKQQIFRADTDTDAGGWVAGDDGIFLDSGRLGAVMEPRQAIRTLGNTTGLSDRADRVFGTAVSVGGWAAASIIDITLVDDKPVEARKLNLSPFLNRSYLVRSPAFRFEGGDVGIPAYFEMGNAFGNLVRIGAGNRVVDSRRITHGRQGIQPMIVPFDALSAVGLLRNFDPDSDRLVATWTRDGGQSWSPAELLELPNPNAPVAAIKMADGQVLMIYNADAVRSDLLVLALSADQGRTWRDIATLEDHGAQAGQSARYPMFLRLNNGEIALTYSVGSKTGIRVHVFNEAWVMAQ